MVDAIRAAGLHALAHVLLALEPGLILFDYADRFSRQLLGEKGAQAHRVLVILLAVDN